MTWMLPDRMDRFTPGGSGFSASLGILESIAARWSTCSRNKRWSKLMASNDSGSGSSKRLHTVKVRARDTDFRIVQLQGNLFVCSKLHGNCCCGWTEKG